MYYRFKNNKFEISHSTSLAYLGLLSLLLSLNIAYADLGQVQSFEDAPEMEDMEEETSAEESEATATSTTTVQQQAIPEAPLDLDRPWTLDTPAGPTAFVLDKKNFEIKLAFEPLLQMISVHSPLFLGVNYGLFPSLTWGVQMGINRSVLTGLRWNFLNYKQWSFAAETMGGTTFNSGNGYSWFNRKDTPFVASLISSWVISNPGRVHFSLSGGRNGWKSDHYYTSYDYDSNGNVSTATQKGYQENAQRVAFRFITAYEHRFNSRHGMTWWGSADRFFESENFSRTGDYTTDTNESGYSLLFGSGYHYWRKIFGVSFGLALGPSWTTSNYKHSGSIGYSNSNYTYMGISTTVGGGFHIRL